MNLLFSKNDVYKTRYFLYNYNYSDFRIVRINSCRVSGFEEIKKKNNFIDVNSEEVQRISLCRTKRNIREIALCNNFEYFVTITINSNKCDRYSLDNCQILLKKILKKIKRKYNDFGYIFITEKHKDGAFHFHGLIKGYNDFYKNNNGYFSSKYFDELGYNSFSIIRDYSKCCNYITKYITKDCVKNSNNQIYISSRGLLKATKEEFDYIDFIPSYSNDYVSIKDFSINNLSKEELLYFMKLKEGKKNFLLNNINIL